MSDYIDDKELIKQLKLKVAKKGYEINFSKVEEGYLYSERVCHANSLNQAKSILLKENRYENICLRGEDDEVNYVTIPVVRCYEADKYDFENSEKTIREIRNILDQRKRLNKLNQILENQDITYCYIKKGSYYRPNCCGYTDMRHRAGIYEKQDAIDQAKSCRDLYIIPINITEHNQMIADEIKELEERLINQKEELFSNII